MAYSEDLANRVREQLHDVSGLEEKKMFGGLAFMVNDHMVVGVLDDQLMVRTSPDEYDRLLDKPHITPMNITGKVMKNMILVQPHGLHSDHEIHQWIMQAMEFTDTLPAKP